jgi:plastocyanin
MNTSVILRPAMGLLIALALIVAGCGDGDNGETNDNAPSSGVPRTTATIVSTDNKFDTTKLTVPAGQAVTVTLQNKGQAIHNWRVLNVKDAGGTDVATQLLPGGQSETITFTLDAPGTFSFQCDTHPAEMKGSLTVQ